jgi:hypothetical protein
MPPNAVMRYVRIDFMIAEAGWTWRSFLPPYAAMRLHGFIYG